MSERYLHRDNAEFQQLEALGRNRHKRRKTGLCLVEGVRSINALLRYGWRVQTLYFIRPLSKWAQSVLTRANAEVHCRLSPELMARLSRKRKPSELIATVHIPPDDVQRLPITKDLLVVVVDRSANPGNLGTLLRSADALGAHGLILTGHAVDLYDPEVIAASAGSLFALPSVRLPSHREVATWLEGLRPQLPNVQVVGSSAQATQGLSETDFRRPTVLLVGNETKGLSYAYSEMCDALVSIPMSPERFASSFNVACAATVMLYEMARQRAH